MVLRLYPQPSLFDENVELVRNSTPVPVSAFYLRRPYYVPWSADPTVFILETDEPSSTHEFLINRDERIVTVPGEAKHTVLLPLRKGANRIEITTPTKSIYITVAATAVESWFSALGREYYVSVGQRLEDVQNHFATPWTTRISAHLVPHNDLFLPARMPKVHQTRLSVLASVGQRLGYGDGVRTVASSVSYSTPPVAKTTDSEFCVPGQDQLYPYVTTYPTTGETKGKILDLWTPNTCLAAHQALFSLSLSMGGEDVPDPKPLELLNKDDRQLILRFGGGDREVHLIDPSLPECDDIEFGTSCDSSVRVFGEVASRLDILMASPQLPFDEVVELPINFGFYDLGNFFDGVTGPGPGLGGDDAHDTVDLDDPFGTGFENFSLSRRFDHPGCLDTRLQVGQRMAKFTAPIISTSPPALTPVPPVVEGNLLTIDAEAGAPAPLTGNSVVWAVSNRTYMYEGDHLRFEDPDLEVQVVSAWPVLDSTDQIIASDATITFALVGTQKVLTGPTGFFTKLHEGYGVRVDGTDLFSVVSTSDDGLNSFAVISGNPAVPAAGPFIANVYNPLRDRQDTSEPIDSVLQGVAGSATYEITLSSPLIADLTTGYQLSYRVAPRCVGGAAAGAPTLAVMSDSRIDPGDLIYFDSTTPVSVISAVDSGSIHHTTGMTIYNVELDGVTPFILVDDQSLFSLRVSACWEHGDPVTPLTLISLAPSGYVTY